jgi:hypothetical protein
MINTEYSGPDLGLSTRDVDYTICITCIMYQQLWGYKVEEKLYLGVREQKRLNTTALEHETRSREPTSLITCIGLSLRVETYYARADLRLLTSFPVRTNCLPVFLSAERCLVSVSVCVFIYIYPNFWSVATRSKA